MRDIAFNLVILILFTSMTDAKCQPLISISWTIVFSCNIHVCLTWQAEKGGISFKCKVNKLSWQVMFYNPSNKEIAHCVSPIPEPKCYTSNNNTILQSRITNTTLFIVKHHIDSSLNGQWKCAHGTNVDEAIVNITVLKEEIYKTIKVKKAKSTCYEEFYAWTMIGFISIIIAGLLHLKFSKICRNIGCTRFNGIPVPTSFYKWRHCIAICVLTVVTCIPMCLGFVYKECIYKEYFIIFGICMAVILLMFYHILEKSRQKSDQAGLESRNSHHRNNASNSEEGNALTESDV